MTHGLGEGDWERGDMEYHRGKDDGRGDSAVTRFYIVQSGAVAWQVVSGPYFSREAALPYLSNWISQSSTDRLRMAPAVVSRLWLSEHYPFTEEGEVALLEAIKEAQ